MKNDIRNFRLVAFLEGLSFLILLFLCMPLKYYFDMPTPVRIVGMAHGVLFIAYVFFLMQVHTNRGWTIKKSAIAFLASLVPFGTFILDARVLSKEN